MMATKYFKLTAIYRQADDLEKVDSFFNTAHLQLAERLPGLLKSEITRIHGKPGSQQSRFYLMYELYFESEEAYLHAFATEAGLALVQALKPWIDARLLSWYYGETYEETAEERASYRPA